MGHIACLAARRGVTLNKCVTGSRGRQQAVFALTEGHDLCSATGEADDQRHSCCIRLVRCMLTISSLPLRFFSVPSPNQRRPNSTFFLAVILHPSSKTAVPEREVGAGLQRWMKGGRNADGQVVRGDNVSEHLSICCANL